MKFSLSKSMWKKIGAVLGAVGTLVTIAVSLISIKHSASIEIVDVHFSSVPADAWGTLLPVVDVLVHNTGDHTAVVTQAEFKVIRIWSLMRISNINEFIQSSAQYDVVFYPNKDTPYRQMVPVAHVLKPDESDRFKFVVKSEPLKPFEDIYEFQLSLHFDSKKQTAERTIVLVLPDLTANPPDYFYSAFEAIRKEANNDPVHHKSTIELLNDPIAEQAARVKYEHNREALLEVTSLSNIDYQTERAINLEDMARKERENKPQ